MNKVRGKTRSTITMLTIVNFTNFTSKDSKSKEALRIKHERKSGVKINVYVKK